MFEFTHLDGRTREFMLAELDFDISQGLLYVSPRLSNQGIAEWPSILRSALQSGNDDSLARDLRVTGILNSHESRRTRSGTTTARIPATAPETLAEGEFNRFYMRGLCRRAIQDGVVELVIYRAKTVLNPRPESQALLGKQIAATALLDDLRAHPGVEPALGLPPGPNSGLSVRFLIEKRLAGGALTAS